MRIRNWLLSVINAIRILTNRRQRHRQRNVRATRCRQFRRMMAAAAITPLLVASSNADEPLFPSSTFPAGDGPVSVATADFNGDGVTDLASANSNSDDVSVPLGNGDGTFATDQRFGVGDGPRSVTTGDFNGDGLTDLATANRSSDDVSVLLNQSSSDVLIGDVNQDGVIGLLDIAPFVALLISGEFQAEADIDQDGDVDLKDIAPFVDLLSG